MTLQLIPEEKSKRKPLFKTDSEYQAFRRMIQEETRNRLAANQRARALSEKQAREHFITR